ncbi:hypothetical protein [Nitrosopumilus sp.]|uniref:hypothetical protein n=1 Tax=Nitrosopumilus sp. TaxID=2024843 RepID=UPI003D13D4AB
MADLTTSVAINSTWNNLNDDVSLAVKPNAASREREAIVDVTFDDGDYAVDGPIVDFSAIRKFKKIISCEILHCSVGAMIQYVPGAGDDAALGKLKVYGLTAHSHDLNVTGGGTIVTDGNLGIDSSDNLVKVEAGNVTLNVGANSGIQNSAVALFSELPVASTLMDGATCRVRIRGN